MFSPPNIKHELQQIFQDSGKSLEHLFNKYLRFSFQRKVCKNCAYVFLVLFAILKNKQTLLSFIDGDVKNPFEDVLESDDEMFDPTAYESEDETNNQEKVQEYSGKAVTKPQLQEVENPFDVSVN